MLVAGITHLPGVPEPGRGLRDAFPKLTSLDPIWFIFALALQVAHFTCTIALQRIALRTKAWFSVTTSQLSGNAISLIVPGGAAFGAATQFRMLAASGSDPATAVGGLTAISILGIGGLLALPIFVLPAIIAGTPIENGLLRAGRCWASWLSCSSPASGRSSSRWTGLFRWAGWRCADGSEPPEAQGRADAPGCRTGSCSSATASDPCWGGGGGRPCS